MRATTVITCEGGWSSVPGCG